MNPRMMKVRGRNEVSFSFRTLFENGKHYSSMHRWEDARINFEKALEVNPEHISSQVSLLEIYLIQKNLEKFIISITDLSRVKIVELNDPYGPPVKEAEYEGLIASQETYSNALKLNEVREANGFKPLIIIIIPMIKGKNNQRLSSTAIREKLV